MNDLDRKLAARTFDDPKVREFLDDLSLEGVESALARGPSPMRRTAYAEVPGATWHVGDGRPAFADDDPAVMQAIARCATSRVAAGLPPSLAEHMPLTLGAVHPEACGWCDVPLPMLLEACDWDVWRSHFVEVDMFIWLGGKEGDQHRPTYDRAGPTTGTYASPDHRDFWALPPAERLARVESAIAASRPQAEATA